MNYYILPYKGEEFLSRGNSHLEAVQVLAKKLTQDSVVEFKHCALDNTFILFNEGDTCKRELFVIARQVELLD
jgi:hypothetical protein